MNVSEAYALLDSVERVPLLDCPTPLTEVNLSDFKDAGLRLFFKRDDLGSIGGGGNKLRKLEVALARARRKGATRVITFGALQSNHARLAAAAASQQGLYCDLILSCRVAGMGSAYQQSGNLLMARLFGAKIHQLSAEADAIAFAETLTRKYEAAGETIAILPFGGSDSDGVIGMARSAVEIVDQLGQMGLRADHILCASGSGGTQAGLQLGLGLVSPETKLTGLSILHNAASLTTIVKDLADSAATALGVNLPDDPVTVDDRFIGDGYGLTYPAMLSSIEACANRTGILLDPVYTGKAFHGLCERLKSGSHEGEKVIVFLHTGGLPGVFAYQDVLTPRMERMMESADVG